MPNNLRKLANRILKLLNYEIIPRTRPVGRTIWDLVRYPLLCPLGLLLLILAHILLAGGEIVLAVTHKDIAYLFLFFGESMALSLLCFKAYQRWRRTMRSPRREGRKRRHQSVTSHQGTTKHQHAKRSRRGAGTDSGGKRVHRDLPESPQSTMHG